MSNEEVLQLELKDVESATDILGEATQWFEGSSKVLKVSHKWTMCMYILHGIQIIFIYCSSSQVYCVARYECMGGDLSSFARM